MKDMWIVSYDIRDPKRLRKVAKVLEGYGMRIQFSVFRIFANAREIEKVRWELSSRLADEDSILYFRFCNSCAIRLQKNNKTVEHYFDKEVNYKIFI